MSGEATLGTRNDGGGYVISVPHPSDVPVGRDLNMRDDRGRVYQLPPPGPPLPSSEREQMDVYALYGGAQTHASKALAQITQALDDLILK